MKKNFIVTTDSCADWFKSEYAAQDVHCIPVKYVLGGAEISNVPNSAEEMEKFYENLKQGSLPSTVALNQTELEEFFGEVLGKTEGDIIHICLSSGLSLTYDNAVKAVKSINEKLQGRKIYLIDSLIATWGMGMMVDQLVEMRDNGTETQAAVDRILDLRDNMQGWVAVSDLFHLKRGGRISGAKAAIGTVLGIKPIIVLSKKGKLEVQNKMKGPRKAVAYLMEKMETLGEKCNPNFMNGTAYLARTTRGEIYELLKKAIAEKYPTLKVKECIVGTVVGTHLGNTAVALIFEGGARLDIG